MGAQSRTRSVVEPQNVQDLAQILKYHVVSGAAVYSKDLKPTQEVATLEGQSLSIQSSAAGVVINGNSKVTAADNAASNGVVHIIDTVLIPAAATTTAKPKNIVELAVSVPTLSTLVTALQAARLVSALEATGPFTVFAPTNDAFGKLPKAELDRLLEPRNMQDLAQVLKYHVVSGAAVYSKDLKPTQNVKTLEGQALLVESSAA